MDVSVIIPAHNAAQTIAETLESLQSQTFPNWEGIVINDGSTDETTAIASGFAAKDTRIRVVSQSQQGVSVARNRGIRAARFDWLLFLDADDWITPNYLERMSQLILTNASLDAVHCGWSYVALDGTCFGDRQGSTLTDLFPIAAQQCPFIIHACVVRKTIVESVGAFDPTFHTCEDWDLWQRIARTGARFGLVQETLAFYRLRPNSLSKKHELFLTDAMRVLNQGHSPDPRVSTPHPSHLAGQPPENLPTLKFNWLSWLSGLWMSRGKEACHLLQWLETDQSPGLDPVWIANNIFDAVLYAICQPPKTWIEHWDIVKEPLQNFLLALEEKSQAFKLADRTCTVLEKLILQQAQLSSPITIGTTHAVPIEVSEPILDIHLSEAIAHFYGVIELEGTVLGTIELPVCDGWVSRYVLTDAIVAKFDFTWKILGRFFEHTIYNQIADTHIAESIDSLHDKIGWETFLQQLWQRPDWSNEQFYNSSLIEHTTEQKQADQGWLIIEVSADLPDIQVLTSNLNVVITVGGIVLGTVTIPVENNLVTAQALRVAVTTEGGMELCRVCVREGLLERSFSDPSSLRIRLAEAVQRKPSKDNLPFLHPTVLTSFDCHIPEFSQNALMLGRRSGAMGTSASRRSMLPIAAVRELLDAAESANEPVIRFSPTNQPLSQAVYAPEVILQSQLFSRSNATNNATNVEQSKAASLINHSTHVQNYFDNSRNYFETLFATQPDPWKYTTPYEQTKYEQTLALLPSKKIKRALELACAEGHFTTQLAPRVQQLIATDISQIALDRTSQRCAHLPHVSFMRLDLSHDPLPERFQLIVCSEVLYYMDGQEALQSFAQRVAQALEPGGYFLTAHANLVVDEPDRPGYDWNHPFGAKGIGDAFASVDSLQLVKELRTPLYRVQLFQRRDRSWIPLIQHEPKVTELPQSALPTGAVRETILWNGGQPRRYETPQVVTQCLPILMYHQVSPTGSSQLSRWRITPQFFEEQLAYLRDAGYYSVTLADWGKAVATKTPLPGRAILITFDDGYLDFFTNAYPLLRQYGFSATVFLVVEQVGQSNCWDAADDEALRLMNWQQIRQLQTNGIEFGSHSHTHRLLTALSTTEIVQEAARSRNILQRELGVPVRSFAYPYGEFNPIIEHTIGACGYTFGVSCRYGFSQFQDSLLALPRLEVAGHDTLQSFVSKLSL